MKHALLFVSMLLGASLPAGDLPGFVHYRASDLKAYQAKLASKMNERKFASATLDKFDNHFAMIAHREASGEAEIHERMADLFAVESGEATLVVGGEAENTKTVEPGEIRGSSIKGGQRVRLTAGDLVHIPAKMPHQLLIDSGKQFTYFVLKIEIR